MRGLFPQRLCVGSDRIEKHVGVRQESLIAGTDHRKASPFQLLITQRVFGFTESMNAAVQLDDQPQFQTDEVADRAREG